MKKLILISSCIFSFAIQAQDIHFTMWDAVPITTNPASTGVFRGDHRAVINYRNQWSSVGKPYNTYSFMGDAGILKNKWQNGFMGVGINVYKDNAGQNDFGATKVSLGLSNIVFLDDKNSASVGLMGSWGQNALNTSNAEWDAQFNGQYFDPTLSSNEPFNYENKSYFDFSAGVLWAYGTGSKTLSSQDEFSMKAGLAFYHVTRPEGSISAIEKDKLYSRWAFHADAYIGISNSKFAIKPKFLTYIQGPSRQFALGTLLRYMIKEESKYTGFFTEMAISFGGYYRVGDAFAPSVEFEIGGLALGVAYDMNLSGLSVATNGNGGPEVFIKFVSPNPFTYGKGTKSSARFN